MSQQLLKADVLFYQRFLKCNGFYPFKLDGDWGPKTDAADAAFTSESESIAKEWTLSSEERGKYHDPRSEGAKTCAPVSHNLYRC